MAHDVFISYSTKDKTAAFAACATLEARGIRCWIAPRDGLPGTDWGDFIISAIAESHVMVLIFSSSANQSHQVRREVNKAIENEVPIIPVRIEDVKPSGAMELYLDVTHWLDALTEPLDQHLEKLAANVNVLLKRTDARSESSLPIRGSLDLKREPHRSRNKWLWIGGGVAVALSIIVLTAVLMIRSAAQRDERWFVIFGTFAAQDHEGANKRLAEVKAGGHDARIVNTNDYPNFTPNRQAVVMGPYSKARAEYIGKQVRLLIPTIKNGW